MVVAALAAHAVVEAPVAPPAITAPTGHAARRRANRVVAAAAPVPIRQSTWSKKTPGISASEIAKSMKIKPNYLYRVLGELEKEGRVTKKGREYHPAA